MDRTTPLNSVSVTEARTENEASENAEADTYVGTSHTDTDETIPAKRSASLDSDVLETGNEDINPEVSEKMAVLETGVDVKSGEFVTVADAFLMCGLPDCLTLEYEWIDDVKCDDILGQSMVSNILRRLADLSRAYLSDVTSRGKAMVSNK